MYLLTVEQRISNVYTSRLHFSLHYCARETIGLLQRVTPYFIAPDLWSPHSADLNPVDYIVWGVMEQRQQQS